MFTILGADGKEYGPVTAGKVIEWIQGGRANSQTKIKRMGDTEWTTIGAIAEFGGSDGRPMSVPPMVGAPTPVETVPPAEAELADRGLRFGAYLLDYLLGVVCALPGLLLLGPTFLRAVLAASRGQEPDFSQLEAGSMLMGLGLLGLFSLGLLAVQIWLLTTRGQTIAKRLLGIRIVRCPDDAPAGFVHAWLLRNLVPGIIQLVPWFGLVFFLVDACFIFRDDRRCIHDLIAGTRVVKA
jgi:uncharacterized RDD family membrane protein YckC